MILCITPNPAIDRTLIVPGLTLSTVHRARKNIVPAGGKGLNVARVIRTLGGEPLCMGFAGGHSGQLLADLAQKDGLPSAWTDLETRTCTILVAEEGDATVINEPGPAVTNMEWKRLQQDVREQASSAKFACLSGSLPPDSSMESFHELLSILTSEGKKVWVDTSGLPLRAALMQPNLSIDQPGLGVGRIWP
jgi:fructose-1-phosphate kinase PfkB-like protein